MVDVLPLTNYIAAIRSAGWVATAGEGRKPHTGSLRPYGSFAFPAEAITWATGYRRHSPKELLVHLEQRLCAGEACPPPLAATIHPLIHTRTEKYMYIYMHIISSNTVWHTDTYI